MNFWKFFHSSFAQTKKVVNSFFEWWISNQLMRVIRFPNIMLIHHMLPRIIFDVKNRVCHHHVWHHRICRKCVSHNFVFDLYQIINALLPILRLEINFFGKMYGISESNREWTFVQQILSLPRLPISPIPHFCVFLCWTSGIRTHNTWVKVKCINHYTMVQCFLTSSNLFWCVPVMGFEPTISFLSNKF